MRTIKVSAFGVLLFMTSLSLATVSQKKAAYLSNNIVFLKLYSEPPKQLFYRARVPKDTSEQNPTSFFKKVLMPSDTIIKLPEVVITPLNEGHCTGTVIHPKFILTAAHCLSPYTMGVYEPLRNIHAHHFDHAFDRDTLSQDPNFNAATQVTYNNNFDFKPLMRDYVSFDVGLIYYKDGVPNKKFQPVMLYGGTLKNLIDQHKSFEVAGFGVSPAFLKKESESINTKVQYVHMSDKDELKLPPIELTVDEVQASLIHAYKHSLFAELVFEQTDEHGITPGDSGGPTFLTLNNKMVQVGINSYIDLTARSLSSSTFIGTYRPWINEVVRTQGKNPNEIKWVQ